MACCTHHPVISETLLTKPFCIHVSLLSHWKLERELYCAPLENACHTQCQATLTTGAPLTISSCGQVCRLVPWAILILLCSWGCKRSDQFLCCYSILIPLHALSSSRLPPSMSKGAPAWLWHVYFWEARRGSSLFRLPWTLLPSRPSSAPMFFHSKTSVMSKPVSNSCLASHRFPVSCSWITPAAVKSWVIPEI